jgi:pyrroloquinoline quinone biosynthesis protein B
MTMLPMGASGHAPRRWFAWAGCALVTFAAAGDIAAQDAARTTSSPWLVVLGIAQDGGIPQAGSPDHPAWENPELRRRVVSLGLVAPASGRRWIFEATPDFREQLHLFDEIAPADTSPTLAGIFLTHAHIGHYTGLMFLGHESLGEEGVPVYAMPRMSRFLKDNGPWSQLVRYGNVVLRSLEAGVVVELGESLSVTPFLVPHRQEFAEVVGYRIEGPNRAVLFIPDIDSWEEWDASGVRIEDEIARVDVAYLDATFFSDGEIPGRDMSGFPHPFLTHSMERFSVLPEAERAKVRFIHLNHSNPAADPNGAVRAQIEAGGFRVAEEGERVIL